MVARGQGRRGGDVTTEGQHGGSAVMMNRLHLGCGGDHTNL